ncbi:MAG: hypothetical protein D6705_06510 [Deltaproteobacteria bacterium]|nr:MAG: hypothetical protein D6705_06510 [Deltaproteobacteria bacterium]
MPKYRYEFPPREAHFVDAPTPGAVVRYLKRRYPHNYDDVLATLVEIPRFPDFVVHLDEKGHPRRRDDGSS